MQKEETLCAFGPTTPKTFPYLTSFYQYYDGNKKEEEKTGEVLPPTNIA